MIALFQLLYSMWPVFFIAFLIPWPIIGNQPLQFRLKARLGFIWGLWIVWLIFLITLNYNQVEALGFIPEPINTFLFFTLGILLSAAFLIPLLAQLLKSRENLLSIQDIETLRLLPPQKFEELIAVYFRQYGYQVDHTGRTGDHGVDLIVQTPDNGKWIVQCKRWKGAVGEPLVRDLYGAMFHEGASRAFLMTTGTFTQAATAWVLGKPIILYDGEGLVKLIKRTQKQNRQSLSTS